MGDTCTLLRSVSCVIDVWHDKFEGASFDCLYECDFFSYLKRLKEFYPLTNHNFLDETSSKYLS